MKKRWKIFWIVCGVMFLTGVICCVVANRVFGVTLTDIAAEFPHGIVIGSDTDEDDWDDDGDWDDDDDWDDDEDDWDDDDDEDDWDDDWDDDDDKDHAAKIENNKNKAATNTKESGKERMLNGNGKAVYQQITSIKGKIYAGRVYFKTAATDEITVESKDTHEKLGFQAYEEDGVLYLKTNKKVKNKNDIGKGSITVTLPEKQTFDKIDLTLKAGELNADEFSADDLEIKNGAGKVFVKDFTAKKAEFESGAGSLSGTGDVSEKMDIDCGVGEIDLKLKGSQNDYNYDLECGIGEIQCGDNRYSGFGREVHVDNQASKEMKIDCGIGQITISYATEM